LNKNVIHETQLVKINSFIDKGDSMINLKKLKKLGKHFEENMETEKK
jgi:hypothetical protein